MSIIQFSFVWIAVGVFELSFGCSMLSCCGMIYKADNKIFSIKIFMQINEYFLFHLISFYEEAFITFWFKVCLKNNLKMKNLQKKQKVLKS